MAQKKEVYISDRSAPILKYHGMRTAADSAAYLLPSLRPQMQILDIGCGPGSITCDLAVKVHQGHVVGIDNGPEAIEKARASANERNLENINFQVGDAHALDFPDQTFDVVHAHQVLQHIGEPSHALREWRRVVKPGGLIACREWDCESAAYFPENDGIRDFWALYRKVARSRGGEPNGGRHLVAWAREAGFRRDSIETSASIWCFSRPGERAYWSTIWIDRLSNSTLRAHMLAEENIEEKDLERFVQMVGSPP